MYWFAKSLKELYLFRNEVNVPYSQVQYTQPGTYLFTVPNGITEIMVSGCGGGAGGVTCGAYNQSPAITLTAGNGGDTKVGTITIAGGKGGTGTLAAGNAMTVNQPEASQPKGIKGETKTCRNVDFTLNGKGFKLGTSPNAVTADIMNNIGYYARNSNTINDTYYTKTGQGSVELYGIYGAGGGTFHFFDSDGGSNQIGIAGNSGAFVSRQKLSVTAGETIAIEVGAGGKHAFYSNDGDGASRFRVSDGTNGFVIIEYFNGDFWLPDYFRPYKCYIKINSKITGGILANAKVQVNGIERQTDADGRIEVVENMGSSKVYNILDDVHGGFASITVKFNEDGKEYTVTLDQTYTKMEYRKAGTYTVTVPVGISAISVTVAGGGGGGGAPAGPTYDNVSSGGAGGSGELIISRTVSIGEQKTFRINVGAGGSGGSGQEEIGTYKYSGNSGGDGGNTTFDSIVIAGAGGGGDGGYAHVENGTGGVSLPSGAKGSTAGNGYGGLGGSGGHVDSDGGGRTSGGSGDTGYAIVEYGGSIGTGEYKEESYTTPGTYQFTASAGMHSVAVEVVCGGGAYKKGEKLSLDGDSGRWAFGVADVVAGQTYEIVVGKGADIGEAESVRTSYAFGITSGVPLKDGDTDNSDRAEPNVKGGTSSNNQGGSGYVKLRYWR